MRLGGLGTSDENTKTRSSGEDTMNSQCHASCRKTTKTPSNAPACDAIEIIFALDVSALCASAALRRDRMFS